MTEFEIFKELHAVDKDGLLRLIVFGVDGIPWLDGIETDLESELIVHAIMDATACKLWDLPRQRITINGDFRDECKVVATRESDLKLYRFEAATIREAVAKSLKDKKCEST